MYSNPVRLLITSPTIASFLESSLTKAVMHKINASGVPVIMRIPTRNPSGEPQPKPGTPHMAHRIRTHGDKASQNPILPVCILFIFLNLRDGMLIQYRRADQPASRFANPSG